MLDFYIVLFERLYHLYSALCTLLTRFRLQKDKVPDPCPAEAFLPKNRTVFLSDLPKLRIFLWKTLVFREILWYTTYRNLSKIWQYSPEHSVKNQPEKEGFSEEWELRHGRRGGERFISHPCVFRNARRSPALSVFSGIISPEKGVFQCPQRT